MDKQKLKELMRDQISTFSGDITKKLNYLVNSELLDYNYYKIDIYRQKLNFKNDSDLLNAFIGNSDGKQINDENVFANAFMTSNPMSHSSKPQSNKQNNSSTDVNDRIQNINSRLAALRGLSMPGDYLRKS